MGMRAPMAEENESSMRLRERVAVMDQRMTNVEQATQRQLDNHRLYLDEKFLNLKNEMKVYIDQKFLEMNHTITLARPSTATLDNRVWFVLLGIGVFVALSFVILATGGAPWTR